MYKSIFRRYFDSNSRPFVRVHGDRSPNMICGRALFFWFRRLRLVQRRTVWCPTFLGHLCIVPLLVLPIAWWCIRGESFLSATERLPAEVLVVEGWIGRDGLRAAAAEFEQGGYRYVVASGGLTSGRWEDVPSSYAVMADRELIRLGVPQDKIIVAPTNVTESMRTYESALAVRRALQASGVRPKFLNVFTFGPHARRSRLVFAKVEEPGTGVGVVGWVPSGYRGVPWWQSSERSRELLTETVGYLFEALLNSCRGSDPHSDGA